MDFLTNAAKIAEQVQGGKKHGEGSGGYGDILSGFMGGGHAGDKPQPQPRRDDEGSYGDEGPHASGPSAGAEHKKPDLFGSAQVRSFSLF